MHSAHRRPHIRALLIDVSGTLHVGNSPTPSSVEALKRLRCAGIPFKLCSNTSKESTRSLLSRLNAQGFDVHHDEQGCRELWTSIGVVKHTLHRLRCSRPYLLLSESAREELLDPLSKEDDKNAEFDSVVVGLSPSNLTYDNLNLAFRVLVGETKEGGDDHGNSTLDHGNQPLVANSKQKRLPLIATNKARYVQSDANDRLSLGPGPFVAALEYATGVQAHVVGKPTKSFFTTVIDDFGGGLHGRDGVIAIIGDDVENDLGEGAIDLGLWRVLVRTGKYRQGDEVKIDVVPPNEVCDSFAAFVNSLLGLNLNWPR